MRRSCSLCFLLLASSITFLSAQQQPSPGSPTCSPQAKAITVWKVGSPYENDAPGKAISAELKIKAKSLGCTIHVEAFPAVRFAESFFAAFEKHLEPDVLEVENKGVISGVTMRSGEYVDLAKGPITRTPAAIGGIASNEAVFRALEAVPHSLTGLDETRSSEFLLRTSRNYKAAKCWLQSDATPSREANLTAFSSDAHAEIPRSSPNTDNASHGEETKDPNSSAERSTIFDRPKQDSADTIVVPAGTKITVDVFEENPPRNLPLRVHSAKVVNIVQVGSTVVIPALSKVTIQESVGVMELTDVTIDGVRYDLQTDRLPLFPESMSEATFTLTKPFTIKR
jgi:hypothetical protein